MLEHTSCVGIGGQDMMKTMAITPQKRKKTMDCDYLITPFCFYKAWNTYLKAAFGYVWIQYLIDFGENKIQGSQACRILLGSMVGIYWIYALFGGHYCLGRKGCSQNTPQKRKKTMDCDYLITPFCFYKAWNTYLKTGFGYVWIQYLIDFVEISDDFTNTDADLEPFSFISGTFWMLAWNLLDFISGTSWFYFCKPLSWMTDDTDDFLFAQHVGLNSPDFIFAFWGSVAWVPLISFYFSGVQPHLGAPQGDHPTAWNTPSKHEGGGDIQSLDDGKLHFLEQIPMKKYDGNPFKSTI